MANKTFFNTVASMPALKNVSGLGLSPTYQTVTTAWMSAARLAGGDPMDLDPENGNFIGKLSNYYYIKRYILIAWQPTYCILHGKTKPMMLLSTNSMTNFSMQLRSKLKPVDFIMISHISMIPRKK